MQPTSLLLGSDKKQGEFHLLIVSSASASSISPASPDCYLHRMQDSFVKNTVGICHPSNDVQCYSNIWTIFHVCVRSTYVFPCPATTTDPMKGFLPWLIVPGTLLPQRGHSKPTLLPDHLTCLPNLHSNMAFFNQVVWTTIYPESHSHIFTYLIVLNRTFRNIAEYRSPI